MWINLLKIIIYGFLSYSLAFLWAPYLIKLLNWLKFWKKQNRTKDTLGQDYVVAKDFYKKDEATVKTPRSGGLLIWLTTLFIAVFFWLILKITITDQGDNEIALFLNFVNRRQTFIPIGVLFFGSIIGFIDDVMATLEGGGNYHAGGLKASYRIFMASLMALIVGIWLRFRLNIQDYTLIPNLLSFQDVVNFLAELNLGSWLPDLLSGLGLLGFITAVIVYFWSSTVMDGFDGLFAGTLIPIYILFTIVSWQREYLAIATLLSVITGSMVAYLWFNLPPAKFYLGETGSSGLLLTLATVAFLIDAVYLLPIAGIMLILTSLSNIIQLISRKFFKQKVFLVAPLHHHFQALGYSKLKITVGYWLITIVACLLAFWLAGW